jgi:hypothetical protein
MTRNSTPWRWSNAKNSSKSSFTIRPTFLAHALADLEPLLAAEGQPVVEVDLLGFLERLGYAEHPIHGAR